MDFNLSIYIYAWRDKVREPASLKASTEHLTVTTEHLTSTREYLRAIKRALAGCEMLSGRREMLCGRFEARRIPGFFPPCI